MDVNDLSRAIADSCDADDNYTFQAQITSKNEGVCIVNPQVSIVVKPLRTLELAGGSTDEVTLADAKWYDSFLLWGAAEPDTVSIDLSPVFNQAAREARAALRMRVAVPEGEPDNDFTLVYAGRDYAVGDTLIITPETPATMGLLFKPDAKTEKRYFRLVPVAVGDLERLNGVPLSDIRDNGGLSFRSKYSVEMNPLKFGLMWFGIFVLAALVFWFVVCRPIYYPGIKARTLEIAGPDTYWRRAHIKGHPRVVLTSKKQSQNIFSRFFIGTTLYVKAPHWTSDILILPASGKKIKIKCPEGWNVSPGSILSAGAEYTLRSPQGSSSTLKI